MIYNLDKIRRPQIVRSWETFKDHTFSQIEDIKLYNEMMETEFGNNLKNHIYDDETLIHIFRSTFLTQIFTLLEYNLRSICLNIQRFNHQDFSVLDLKGNSDIEKAQLYLKKTIEINIGEFPEWNFIKDCQRLRNNIVHENSYFEKQIGFKGSTDFEKVLKKLNAFKIVGFAQDMTFKKMIKTYLITSNVLNKELIDNVSSLFEKVYNHIITFNTVPEEDIRN